MFQRQLLHVLLALCIFDWLVSTNLVASQEQSCDPFYSGTTADIIFAAEFSTECPCTSPCTADKVVEYVGLYSMERGENNYTEIDLKHPKASKLFNTEREIKFLIPGYTTSGLIGWCPPMATELVKVFDGYVIIVDYFPIASCNYEQSALEIAPSIAQYIANIIRIFNFDLQKIELIAHSLGAHIAGYIGANLHGEILMITGLDPAGPDSLIVGLNKTNAQFVQVLHTDPGDLGTALNRGDVDFWANNKTEFQPGCTDLPCGHFKALFIYFASIFSQYIFIGERCGTSNDAHLTHTSSHTSIFGLYNDGKVGQFCFNTSSCFPYTLCGKDEIPTHHLEVEYLIEV